MSDTTIGLRRKLDSAGELQSVVRTMKALAASSIGQYERSVLALSDYNWTVELGLGLCLRETLGAVPYLGEEQARQVNVTGAIIFGSDQGLVGQFNDVIADFAIKALADLPGKTEVWAVGERVQERLVDAGVTILGSFPVPNSVQAITPLVGQIQIASENQRSNEGYGQIYVFHNRPQTSSLYEPISQRLLPLDAKWRTDMLKVSWPNKHLPEVLGSEFTSLRTLIREYLFISLFRACAESLASENASRLSAMGRADRNISELKDSLQGKFNRLRQTGIDEELFDVISGFEALSQA